MKVVCGIISYLPDDMELKKIRITRLNNLIQQVDAYLNVPIMIIAQNGGGISLREGTTNNMLTIYTYKDGLGINKARKELRTKFLESDYDYLIMLDDDGQLAGDIKGAKVYMNDILTHPGMWGSYKPSLLKLFAISKEMYSLIEIPDGGADSDDPHMRLFEDMYIEKSLRKVYPEKEFKFHRYNFMEISDAAYDKANTGWHRVYVETSEFKWDRHDTGNQTRGLISQATAETLLHPEMYDRSKTILYEDFLKQYPEL